MTQDNAKVPPAKGVTGIAMLTPFIGIPMALHALTGAVVGGLGLAVASAFLGPAAGKIRKSSDSLTVPIVSKK